MPASSYLRFPNEIAFRFLCPEFVHFIDRKKSFAPSGLRFVTFPQLSTERGT